jgi:hypothetical protein
VWMPLYDLAPGLKGGLVKRIRELAQSAANRRDHAALLQHAPDDKATAAAGATHLLPETEDFTGRHQYAIKRGGRAAQVLDLSKLMSAFGEALVGPQCGAGLRHDERQAGTIEFLKAAQPSATVANAAGNLMDERLGAKHRLGRACRNDSRRDVSPGNASRRIRNPRHHPGS